MESPLLKIAIKSLVFAVFLLSVSSIPGRDREKTRPEAIEEALAKAGKNRPEIEKALQGAVGEQKTGMEFLVINMPLRDLQTLKSEFLLENVQLAYKARNETPWGKKIPEAIFLNDVLAYANVDEERDPWRKDLYERTMPLIKDCKTPTEAAMTINAKLFGQLKVGYSTGRKKAQQSPRESIEQGKASCTGLSIILSDACRSVGIPARLVGTPLWLNKRGNHTWVEIWDGDWHFTGACEPDLSGLDRGWFVGDASMARKDIPEHAIYATSFRRTDIHFPLVWEPGSKVVSALNVTDRYAKPVTPSDTTRFLLRVWKGGKKERLVIPVTLVDTRNKDFVLQGVSRGEKADTNDILEFNLPRNRTYKISFGKPVRQEKEFTITNEKQYTADVEITEESGSPAIQKQSSAGK